MTTPEDPSHFKTLLAGRFALRVPLDWHVGHGVGVRIREVALNEVALARDLSPADAFEAKWAELLAKRRAKLSSAIEGGDVEKVSSELAPAKTHILLRTPSLLTIKGVPADREAPPLVYVLSPVGSWAIEAEVERRPWMMSVVLSELKKLLAYYHPLAAGSAAVEPRALYMEYGALALPPDPGESAEFYVTDPGGKHHISVSFSILLEDDDDAKSVLATLGASIAESVLTTGSDLEKVRSGTRKVAGFGGEEVFLRDGTSLSLHWRRRSQKAGDVNLELSMEVDLEAKDKDAVIARWDQVLRDLAYLPDSQEQSAALRNGKSTLRDAPIPRAQI